MPELLKEKYNIFKGLVGLFDTKLSAAVIVTLLLFNVYQFFSNKNSEEKLYGMVIEEVRKQVPKEVVKQVAPVAEAAQQSRSIQLENGSKLDSIKEQIGATLHDINSKYK